MPEGRIKKLVADKGFGFIESQGADLFFHHTAVEGERFDNLTPGQTVSFEIGKGPKGARAEHVRLIEG